MNILPETLHWFPITFRIKSWFLSTSSKVYMLWFNLLSKFPSAVSLNLMFFVCLSHTLSLILGLFHVLFLPLGWFHSSSSHYWPLCTNQLRHLLCDFAYNKTHCVLIISYQLNTKKLLLLKNDFLWFKLVRFKHFQLLWDLLSYIIWLPKPWTVLNTQ